MKPDYTKSIVNLMSSIGHKFAYDNNYSQLENLPSEKLQEKVVLIVIDGLGYEFLKEHKESFMYNNLQGSMTSTFPSTTATAMTAYYTGVAPQQHGYTGWFTYLKEIGAVSTILRHMTYTGEALEHIKASELLGSTGFFEKINCASTSIIPKQLKDSEFTKTISKNAKIKAYSSLKNMIKHIIKSTKKNNSYTLAYWPGFDSISHHYGTQSTEAEEEFKLLDKAIETISSKIKGATLIISADHGMSNRTQASGVYLSQHPKLDECMILPPCAEPRAVFCYVRAHKAKQFEKYVNTKLAKQCSLHTGEELIKKGWFGTGKAHPQLVNRVGDYVLLMKENYAFYPNSKDSKGEEHHIGNHGGVSKEEMLVPLIVLQT